MAQASEIRYLTPPTVDVKKKKYCRFKKSGIKYIDYKDPEFLKKFLNEQGKILPRRITGTSLKFQRRVAQAVKRIHMELILKENVQGLGFKNEIVTVKDGYGRNFLIPTGKAVLASASAKKELAETLKQQAHKLEKIKNDAIALAEKINAVEGIKIATKVSATGAIYGSVTNLHIAEELAKRGIEVDRKSIVLKDVKEVGAYKAAVKLHKDVTAEVAFEVVAEEA